MCRAKSNAPEKRPGFNFTDDREFLYLKAACLLLASGLGGGGGGVGGAEAGDAAGDDSADDMVEADTGVDGVDLRVIDTGRTGFSGGTVLADSAAVAPVS